MSEQPNLCIYRTSFSPVSTQGYLLVDGVMKFYTLEPPDGPELIPAGTYEVLKERSPRFGEDTPHFQNVPGHTYIEIHPGNDAADTKGCILLGMDHSQDWISQSRAAFLKFMSIVPDEFTILIDELRSNT